MKTSFFTSILLVLGMTFLVSGSLYRVQAGERWQSGAFPAGGEIAAPVLKWAYGGCSATCEQGGKSSAAVEDLDGDGAIEIIASASAIRVLDSQTGAIKWSVRSGHDRSEDYNNTNNVGRTWPSIVIGDVDNDGQPEIVTAHDSGWLAVYDQDGYFQSGWPKQISQYNLRSLSVADLDVNGDMEIAVGIAHAELTSTWVFEHNGTVRPGWPQLNGQEGMATGIFNDNIAIGDIDGDIQLEIVSPTDFDVIGAYNPNGLALQTNIVYQAEGSEIWTEVIAFVDPLYEITGLGQPCTNFTQPVGRGNFSNNPATIADVNLDGVNEVIVTSFIRDCRTQPAVGMYMGLFLLNGDRSRFNQDGFDWRHLPVNTGAELPPADINTVQPNPVVADLDSDGYLEILYPSYDGRMHAFWLDKTEHGNWPYSIYQLQEGFQRLASEPVISDLNNDGYAEVIFTSWTQKDSNEWGLLHIVDYLGNPIHEIELPVPRFPTVQWNGAEATPTLANIDGDTDLEIILNTAFSGVVVYDLPGTSDARVLWGTGRANYLRNGTISSPVPSLRNSTKTVLPLFPEPGSVLNYTIRLENPGTQLTNVQVSDPLPPEITYLGDLIASSGAASYSDGLISWNGAVTASNPVVITFNALINNLSPNPYLIVNSANINDGQGDEFQRVAMVIINGFGLYLPVVQR